MAVSYPLSETSLSSFEEEGVRIKGVESNELPSLELFPRGLLLSTVGVVLGRIVLLRVMQEGQ